MVRDVWYSRLVLKLNSLAFFWCSFRFIIFTTLLFILFRFEFKMAKDIEVLIL